MGHWKLIDNLSEAEALRDLVSRGIPAEFASEQLYGLIGSDDLYDRLSKARKKHPSSDVSSLVVNAVAEIYFTGSEPERFTSREAVDVLRDIVETRKADRRDYFFVLADIQNFSQAIDRFSHWLEIRPQDKWKWAFARDSNGYDFVARNERGEMFRLSAIDDYALEIDPANNWLYDPMFATSPAPSR